MNEQYIYSLIRAILSKSAVIQGRFAVAEGYGNDLNADNFGDLVRDALGGIKSARKYPCVILMPPTDAANSTRNYSRYNIEMFFLTQTFQDGVNDLKGIVRDTNTSAIPIQDDWAQMRNVAGQFRRAFNEVVRSRGLVHYVREAQGLPDLYRRVSLRGNDRVSGVSLNFQIDIAIDCGDLTDYPESFVNDVQVPAQ